MLPSVHTYLYILFAWFLGLCYGFVLLSSAAGQNGDLKLFEIGTSIQYRWHSRVILNEKDPTSKGVGFYITGIVNIKVVWENDSQKLLIVEVVSPQLHIRSRKAPSPDGFVPHTSELDSVENKPFLIVWNNGKIEKVLFASRESLSLINLKKGVASLFQLQLVDGESVETDASGKCYTRYFSSSPASISKAKLNCSSDDLSYVKGPKDILGVSVKSLRQTEYELDSDDTYIKSVLSLENHVVYLPIKEEIGNLLKSEQSLIHMSFGEAEVLGSDNIEDAIEKISSSEGVVFTQETLLTEKESSAQNPSSFTSQVDELRDYLKTENLGTSKPAKAFIKLVDVARLSTKDDISKALVSKKNKPILAQLYDVLGYVQTTNSHAAVTKNLHFDKENHADLSERYLWALSFSSHPNPEVIDDLLKKFSKSVNIPVKVRETLILTIASMGYKLQKLNQKDIKTVKVIEDVIINNLDYASGEDRYVFFRALKNLHSSTSIPFLLNYIENGTQKDGALSWKAIRAFDPILWNKDIRATAVKSFFQLDRKYDSSSRTIAVEILIESGLSDKLLEELLNFLVSNDPAYEIKQYLLQKIKMLSDEDPSFKKRVEKIIKSNPKINNYSGLSPRGLSTAISRRFLTNKSANGSLVSVQEMKTGIVKRGAVNIVLEKDSKLQELFSLGIFSGGLSNFISSGSNTDEAEEELATAGMELTVLDTQIRPFVFFSGQGELMGHVWSGTASELTPAFQVLALLQDYEESIRLGTGYIAELNVKGSTSFDLSGKIEISLWNRNAQSLVQKSAGFTTVGSTTVDTMFVKSKVEFSASIETKLDLQTDIDFSSNVHLCMRLTQPDAQFRHNIFKIERIPGSKHKLRISKYKISTVPGTSYFLNKKNNEMCSAIFS